MRCNESPERRAGMQFTVVHLQSVLALAKKLLTKDILTFLDEEAQQVSFTHDYFLFYLHLLHIIPIDFAIIFRCTVPAKYIFSRIVHSARR